MTATLTASAKSAPRYLVVETQRRRRGHRFTAPAAERKRVPALYATEATPLADKVAGLHYFAGGWDWYVVELDAETGRAFGLVVHAGQSELGYFDLAELEALNVNRLVVERDCWWTPVALSEVTR